MHGPPVGCMPACQMTGGRDTPYRQPLQQAVDQGDDFRFGAAGKRPFGGRFHFPDRVLCQHRLDFGDGGTAHAELSQPEPYQQQRRAHIAAHFPADGYRLPAERKASMTRFNVRNMAGERG